jgi:tripartite-type tricarboxylate transporter receptor subunit TctC
VAALSAALLVLPATANSQVEAKRPISLIVGWPAGGSVDHIARSISPELARHLGQPLIIDNTPGAGSVLALQRAFNAPSDGHSLYLGSTELIVPPMVNSKVRYDWKTKLAPLGQIGTVWFVLTANANAPYTTLRGMLDHARAQPDGLTYASAGIASTQHMLGELIRERTQARIVHVPYRGGPQFTQDLLSGNVDLAWFTVAGMLAQMPSGKLKPIAVSSPQRLPQLPHVPAMSELDELKGISMGAWLGMFVPIGTPAAETKRLSAALGVAMKSTSVSEPLERAGFVVQWSDGAALGRFIDSEVPNYRQVVEFAKMKVAE